jgi:LysR family glycine cleavage system transcriptional activator
MRELPPLNALRAFEALGQCGSLSAAAERLNVTHGAISKQIKLLEGHLSIQLITRAGRGVELTAEGRRLMDRLTHAFGQLDAALQCLDESSHEGTITIGCMPSLATNWLIPKLEQFSALYPKIDIVVMSTNSADAKAIDAVRADLYLLYGQPDWPGKQVRLLTPLTLFPVCSPGMANSLPGLNSVQDLFNYPLLDNPEGTQWRDYFLAYGLDVSAARRPYRFQDFTLCLAAARAGLGLAMGDNVNAVPDLVSGRLVRPFRETIRRQSLAYYLISRPGIRSASLSAFSNWLIAEMKKTAALP